MNERRWVENLLRLIGFVGFAVAVLGVIIFIWGSVSPGWFRLCGRPMGLRPTGLFLLIDGFCGGLVLLGFAQVIGFLRVMASK
jgi:hypothetical protein